MSLIELGNKYYLVFIYYMFEGGCFHESLFCRFLLKKNRLVDLFFPFLKSS